MIYFHLNLPHPSPGYEEQSEASTVRCGASDQMPPRVRVRASGPVSDTWIQVVRRANWDDRHSVAEAHVVAMAMIRSG